MGEPRMTTTTVLVLHALVEAPETERYGLEVMAMTALPSGTVFPILARLEGLEWLESGWEDIDPSVAGRPRRRYYRLTHEGSQAADAALARVREERLRRTSRLRHPSVAPGRGLAGGVA